MINFPKVSTKHNEKKTYENKMIKIASDENASCDCVYKWHNSEFINDTI